MTGSSFVRFYREYKKIFACSGILFNHESPLRSENYLSKKITSYIAKLDDNTSEKLSLGGLNIAVDWGYAPDYVDAIWRVMQTEYPDDFIISTGVKKTIKDFVKTAFEHVNLDYRDYIFIDSNVLNRKNNIRIGSPQKLIKTTGWSPSINFEEMVRKLVDNELDKFKTYKEK
jgi:GDPmannose 4,6-dehydratase